MSDLQKKLHSYSRRADSIAKGFTEASTIVGVDPVTLETHLLQTTMKLESLCRSARRLLLQTSIVNKEDFTAQVCNTHGYHVEERDGVVHITLPTLPLKKPDKANCSFIAEPLMWYLQEYYKERPPRKYDSARITISHCYPEDTPKRMVRDYDNIEVKKILDILTMFYLHDDNMGRCEVLHTSEFHEHCKTEITITDRF